MALEFIDNYKVQFQDNRLNENGLLNEKTMHLLEEIILKQYDGLDGIEDKIINDPSALRIDYSFLPICMDNKTDSCFTKDQIEVIKSFYQGVSVKDEIIYPGHPIGSELGWYEVSLGIFDGAFQLTGVRTVAGAFGSETFKYFVFNDSDWNLYDYDYSSFHKDTEFAASFLNATSTNFNGFKAKGGKLIMYHGWSDQVLTAFRTIEYYNKIAMSDKDIDEYMRFYLVPGMFHCTNNGPGPSNVDWLAYLRDWVENGKAPHKIIVSKYENSKLIMTRPLFPYPSTAVYDGIGDPKVDSSFIEK
jgi:feruloyl esterase